ncbi:MAG: nucleotide exchange factor GrpE [Alphaproteobacteria bacterium]|nr:nucleotide exchange factor GrpE [Alphaproteobacteria bacterium]
MTSSENPPTQEPTPAANDAAPTAEASLVETAIARAVAAEARIAELEAEQTKLKDQALRALAEAENTRRRAQREIEERERFALTGFARELTSVVDNLRRALETLTPDARAADGKFDQFAQGIELTEREFLAILDRNGIKRVVPTGLAFDHNLHQAIAQIESPDAAPGTVLQVVQAGYTLQGRILRPAMVVVAKAPSASPPPSVDTSA